MDNAKIFEIALRLVERERVYNRLVELCAPAVIIEQSKKLLDIYKVWVAQLEINEKVLLLAREYADAQRDKTAVVEKSLLGEMLYALELQRTHILGMTYAPKLFGDEMCHEDWKNFLIALDEGNKEQILDNIWKLLIAVKWDIVRTNFRPLPYNIVM